MNRSIVGLLALALVVGCGSEMTEPDESPAFALEDVVRLSLVESFPMQDRAVRLGAEGIEFGALPTHDDWDELAKAKVDQDGRRWFKSAHRTADDVPVWQVYDDGHLFDVAVRNVFDARGGLILAMDEHGTGYVLSMR